MTDTALWMTWDGDHLTPASPHWTRKANERLVVGQKYAFDPQEPRSLASHRQYFAAINEAWANLPEEAAERLASPEHLRKFCLIKTGYRDERSIVCASKAEAARVAAFVKPMDEFAFVLTEGATVSVFTAKSQSMRAMGKATFQASKDAVLAYLDQLLGVQAGETQRAGEAA